MPLRNFATLCFFHRELHFCRQVSVLDRAGKELARRTDDPVAVAFDPLGEEYQWSLRQFLKTRLCGTCLYCNTSSNPRVKRKLSLW